MTGIVLYRNRKEKNMAKGKSSVFFCQSCGYESTKWMGQCPACKEWNTMVEEVVDKKTTVTHKQITELQVAKLNDVQSLRNVWIRISKN